MTKPPATSLSRRKSQPLKKLGPLLFLLLLLMVCTTPVQAEGETPEAIWQKEMETAPFSYRYGGKTFRAGKGKSLEGHSFEHGGDSMDILPSPGMGIEVGRHSYESYLDGALNWVVFFRNNGTEPSEIFTDVWAMDALLPSDATGEVVLHYSDGSDNRVDDFHPRQAELVAGATLEFSPSGGRSSDGVAPYFNLVFPDGFGLMIGVGWTGQWKAVFDRSDKAGVRVRIGMEKTHLRLHPGESIRTPGVLVIPYQGDRMVGHNQLRRFLLGEMTPAILRDPLRLPVAASGATLGFNAVTESNQIEAIRNIQKKGLPVNLWWMDAGWSLGGFPEGMGNPDPDPDRFPNGLRPVRDAAKDAGLDFLLWFEPERVMPGTWLMTHHPEWLLAPGGLPDSLQYQKDWRLLNLGHPEALEWVQQKIRSDIREYGVDIYRHDFNMHPLYYWRNNEPEDRQGITEIRYIEGLYAFFDHLRYGNPELIIDNCASGGRRLDYEMMRRSIPLWRSDYCWDPLGAQNIQYGLSHWLPLHGLGAVSTDPYDFRSGYGTNASFAFDYYDEEGDFWGPLNAGVREYREVRPYFSGDFYPLTPYTPGEEGWMSWQFHRADLDAGVIQAFRRRECPTESLRVRLHGLAPQARYEIRDFDSERTYVLSGAELTETGLEIRLDSRPASALMMYHRILREQR